MKKLHTIKINRKFFGGEKDLGHPSAKNLGSNTAFYGSLMRTGTNRHTVSHYQEHSPYNCVNFNKSVGLFQNVTEESTHKLSCVLV